MVLCAMIGCSNRTEREKSKRFFRLPTVITHQGDRTHELSRRRQREWLATIKRKDLNLKNLEYIRVCSDHFVQGVPAKLYDSTNPDWVPSLKLGYDSSSTQNKSERYSRIAERNTRKRSAPICDDYDTDHGFSGTPVQTELTAKKISLLQEEVVSLRKEKADLIEQAERMQKKLRDEHSKDLNLMSKKVESLQREIEDLSLTEDTFKENNSKVLFFTGLSSWSLLEVLFEYVKPNLKQLSVLTPFQQLLVTLMRMRLGLSGQDLAYRFKVHSSTISRTFLHVLGILYVKLKPLILWPDRDSLRKTMPMDFRKHFPNCVVIVDCFEIFLERPTNLLARAQTYSAYKHHNTVKYLLGITPQGTVSYISEGWGGRASDKHITEHCSLLQNLVPGDTILADRGFDIGDSVGLYCSSLKLPAFTKGKTQLSGIEVEQSRQIANVRIHVERVIGNIRQKYSILSATQPIDFVSSTENVTTLDKIVYVSCGLINMCDSVVPFD